MSTHLRNILLQKRRVVAPAIPPVPPGPVVGLNVVTPHTSNSGIATATFYSPEGAAPGTLDYVIGLTGGPGVVTITSIVPIP